jgi:HSP20 family protein
MTNSLVQLFRPFSVLGDFDRDYDRFFDQRRSERVITPACDIVETGTNFELHVDLPGFSRKDIAIEAHDGNLRVSAERKLEHQEDKGLYRSFERAYGKFERTFTLPSEVDANQIDAKYEDGVLKVMVPKTEARKPKQIPIREAG